MLFRSKIEASNPAVATAAETRSGNVRRLQISLRLARKGVIVPSVETNTLPESVQRMQGKRLRSERQAGRHSRPVCQKEVLLLLLLRVADAAVVTAVGEINH